MLVRIDHTTSITEHAPADDLPSLSKLSLKDTALSRTVDAAFQSDDIAWLDEAELLPDFQTALRARLYAEPEKTATPRGRALFGRGLIDLTPFSFAPSDLRSILTAAWKNTKLEVKTLILPNTKGLTKADLRTIVQEFSPPSLNLGETPGISLRKLFPIVSGSSVVDFTCSALYRRSLELTGQRGHLLPNIPT